jgi:hypothetical protein
LPLPLCVNTYMCPSSCWRCYHRRHHCYCYSHHHRCPSPLTCCCCYCRCMSFLSLAWLVCPLEPHCKSIISL